MNVLWDDINASKRYVGWGLNYTIQRFTPGKSVGVHSSLVNQTTPSTALDVLRHHQHGEGGSGHSGTVFVTQWNAPGWDVDITACSVVTTVCR